MAHTILTKLEEVQNLIVSGRLNKAAALCKKILNRYPRQPDALHLTGLIALRRQHYARAIRAYEKAVAIKPNDPTYHYNLGLAHLRAEQHPSAIEHLQKTVALRPDMACAYSDLCLALTRAGAIEAAVAAGEKAVELAPTAPAAHNNLALAYDARRDFDASFQHHRIASRLLPDHPGIQFDLGRMYVSHGDLEAAGDCFKRILRLQPDGLAAYGNLVRITKYHSPEHEDTTRLKAFLDQEWLSDDQRTTVLFALGKIYQDCGLYEEAFSYFERGNRLQDAKYRFDPRMLAQAASLLIDNCTTDLFDQKCRIGNPTETPVFIIGAPRSGTTLTEQILSSHPDVFGAGELQLIPRTADRLQEYLQAPMPYPQCLIELAENSINTPASEYLKQVRSLANGERRIIDKMPGNFLHLGLIHILFPNAKIIHCRREPRDTCISMFCQYFSSGVPYSYDLYKLGVFYSQYERTMEHWRKVLPSDTMIEIEYEKLVNNQEAESRRLLDFLGLEWHDGCLEFYKQRRSVNTASDTQVIQPLYSSSIGRWKHYQRHLRPLEDGFLYRKDR